MHIPVDPSRWQVFPVVEIWVLPLPLQLLQGMSQQRVTLPQLREGERKTDADGRGLRVVSCEQGCCGYMM